MSHPTHLTHEQLCDLLLDSQPAGPQAEHLRDCPVCAAEYASLRQSLSLFRSATVAWASHTSASRSWSSASLLSSPDINQTKRSFFSQPALWATAAAAFLLAAVIPFALHYNQIATSATANGTQAHQAQQIQPADHIADEALLEEVDQTLSSSVPTPMQPLADPTAGRSSQIDSTPRKN